MSFLWCLVVSKYKTKDVYSEAHRLDDDEAHAYFLLWPCQVFLVRNVQTILAHCSRSWRCMTPLGPGKKLTSHNALNVYNRQFCFLPTIMREIESQEMFVFLSIRPNNNTIPPRFTKTSVFKAHSRKTNIHVFLDNARDVVDRKSVV